MAADLLCFDDLDPLAGECASPIDSLNQDLYHRLIEDPGSNPDDPDAGLGLPQRLSGPRNPKLARDIEVEFEKDPRVIKATALVTFAGEVATISVDVIADAGSLNISVTNAPGGIVRVT